MSNVYLILSTVDDHATASRLSRQLVEEGLVACVNVVSGLISTYRWEDEIRQEEEYLMILKTSGRSLARTQARLVELHPYEVPEVVAILIESGHQPYLDWIASETT